MPETQPDDVVTRQRVEENLDLVDMLARQIQRNFGDYVHIEDLEGFGREALVVAARKFEADRGATFRTWAFIRIRGAMLDAVRAEGNVPRRVYRKLRAMQAADLVHETCEEENAAARPKTAEEADAKLGKQLATSAVAMAMNFLNMRRGDEALARTEDDREDPEEANTRADLLHKVRAAIAARPEAERIILERYYFEEVSLDQLGREMGLSRSWASRLHTRALEAIADALADPVRK